MRTLPGTLAALVLAGPVAGATGIAQFRDWVVGCDNVRTCTAIGLPADDSEAVAYLRVVRTGDPGARAVAELVRRADVATGLVRLTARLDGGGFPGELTGQASDGVVRALVPADVSEELLQAVQGPSARTLRVTTAGQSSAEVSLAGASAALRYMDAAQLRAGTVTALAARGPRGADAVPLPPAPPLVQAIALTQSRARRLPRGVRRAGAGCPGSDAAIAWRAEPGVTLWAVCESAAAYNTTFRFTAVFPGARRRALGFPAPGETRGEAFLVNPALSDDRLRLTAFNKARGLGDCGQMSQWAWSGAHAVRAGYAAMPACRGVDPDDWPVIWRTRVVER